MPGPEELSREELLALLVARDARIDALLVQVGDLTAQVQALVLRLGKDSSNSSKPLSSDGPSRRPRGGSSRKASGRRPGKQPGDPGKTLRLVDDPDERIPIPAPAACRCGTSLVEAQVVGVRRRQVHDLPEIPAPAVTEHAAEVKCCPGCRGEVVGQFPAGVNAPATYGPEITTRVADVVIGHHVPVHRSTVLVMELVGMQVSTGFAAGLRGRAAALIRDGGFLDAVKQLLASAPVVHADETFARADGGTAFVHVACTEHLTLMHTGDRSAKTIDDGGVLPALSARQVLVRDGYVGYAHLGNVLHAWCGSHLLRHLQDVTGIDPDTQVWSIQAADALRLAIHAFNLFRRNAIPLDPDQITAARKKFDQAVACGISINTSRPWPEGNHPGLVLARRLKRKADQVWLFITRTDVPPTNNGSEAAIRGFKLAEKVSGCWRTLTTLQRHCRIRSYLTTAANHGRRPLDAINDALYSATWMPPRTTTPTATALAA